MDDLPLTQDLNLSQTIPEKPVGFLGVNGVEYPLINGVNKIGRKKDTCNVCLDLDSISREHAVIAIRSAHKITLMDINSRNKTMLGMTTLRPYMSYPLSDGDVLQFGDVMAIFRLFAPDDDLPLTQDVDVPETPVAAPSRRRSITTVPETPEDGAFDILREKQVAIKDAVFLEPDKQHIPKSKISSKNNFSTSLTPVAINFDLNESKSADTTLVNNQSIHDLETQLPYQEVDIFSAETQLPPVPENGNIKNEEVDIFNAKTQLPSLINEGSLRNNSTICSTEAQLSMVCEHSAKNQEDNIYKADTQLPSLIVNHDLYNKSKNVTNTKTQSSNKNMNDSINKGNDKINSDIDAQISDPKFEDIDKNNCDEENLPFDEAVEDFIESFQSQSLLTNAYDKASAEQGSPPKPVEVKIDGCINNMGNRKSVISEQKITNKNTDDDEKTDCEDDSFDDEKESKDINIQSANSDKNLDDVSDLPTQIIGVNPFSLPSSTKYNDQTQKYSTLQVDLADQPTQILNVVESNRLDNFMEDLPTQILNKKQSPSATKKKLSKVESTLLNVTEVDEENYYLATQDIVNDLNTPRNPANSTTIQCYKINSNDIQPQSVFQAPFPVEQSRKVKVSPVQVLVTKEPLKKIYDKHNETPDVLSNNTNKTKIRKKEINVNDNVIVNEPHLSKKNNHNVDMKCQQVIGQIVSNKGKELNNLNETAVNEKCHRTRRSRKKSSTATVSETKKRIDELPISNNEQSADNISRSKNRTKGSETRHAKNTKINTKENVDEASKAIKENKITTKRKVKREEDEDESGKSNETDVTLRRSRRQRAANNRYGNDFNIETTSSVSKRSRKWNESVARTKHEESTVYDTSNESLLAAQKHPLSNVDLGPSTKKAKPNDMSIGTNSVLGNRRRKTTQHVLFTALSNDRLRDKLEKLGAVMVNDVHSCTVVVTEQLRRTFKLMCAIGLGKPIVGESWIQACLNARMILDPWQHLITDAAGEKKLNFKLEESLAAQRYFLKSYNVSCTPSVQPSPPELRVIVECSGGAWREGGPRWLCVWAFADSALLPPLAARGATLVSRDAFLGYVMRQRLDLPAPGGP